MEDYKMATSDETLKTITDKITGDPRDEITQATYRAAATLLARGVARQLTQYLGPDHALTGLLRDNREVGEAVVSFALAAILELVPMTSLDVERGQLAYNLRIQSYEELMLHLVSLVPLLHFIEEEAEESMRKARWDRTAAEKAMPEAHEVAIAPKSKKNTAAAAAQTYATDHEPAER
jgi:hypothetical protein